MRISGLDLAVSMTAVMFFPAALAGQPGPVGSAAHGGQLYLQCRACHTVDPTLPNAVGPNLVGVVGAKAAGRPGYAYSPALAASGLTWTPAALDTFLARPSAAVPGTKMAFAGVANPQARADIIAYLATLTAKK